MTLNTTQAEFLTVAARPQLQLATVLSWTPNAARTLQEGVPFVLNADLVSIH